MRSKQGYITIEGGHRVGIAGEIAKDREGITGIKYISFMNIRVAHEKKVSFFPAKISLNFAPAA